MLLSLSHGNPSPLADDAAHDRRIAVAFYTFEAVQVLVFLLRPETALIATVLCDGTEQLSVLLPKLYLQAQ